MKHTRSNRIYPEGVVFHSPGLPRSGYPGWNKDKERSPCTWFASHNPSVAASRQRRGYEMQTRCMAFGLPAAQGSRCAATLGCGIQPLRGKWTPSFSPVGRFPSASRLTGLAASGICLLASGSTSITVGRLSESAAGEGRLGESAYGLFASAPAARLAPWKRERRRMISLHVREVDTLSIPGFMPAGPMPVFFRRHGDPTNASYQRQHKQTRSKFAASPYLRAS